VSIALLETKLYVPRPRPGLVPRRRLIELLDRGTASRLTLVSAPAGFGKTTLLAEWLASNDRPAAWVSLDPSDNDPQSFWSYVIAALQTMAPGVGANAVALLQEPQPPPIETVLTTLLNDLGGLTKDLVLVLDDYHLIDSRDVHEGMEFLLDHAPPLLHLVMATRADPTLPLARLRARGELVEARAAELRFTSEEASAYLTGAVGLALSPEDVAALEERTEGWIAALQLAALSMEGRDDVTDFIAGFAGDDRYVVDYLVEEVVQRQSDRVQEFLLQTSVLGRLSGPLSDAVTGQSDGKAMLEELDRANLFLVPLDGSRRWYRYHHLFADVLHARLLDEQPDLVPDLHRRASRWYEGEGETAMAVDHALAAEDFDRAADLVELAMPALRRDRREATLRGWLEKLPEELFHVRPVLSNGYVGALMSTGEVEAVEPLLRDAERLLDSADAIVVDDEEFRRLPGSVAVHRAGQALMLGDAAGTVTHARRALDLLDENDDVARGAASALMGLASWANGDLEAAHAAYTECTASMKRAGHVSDVLGCAITLGDLRVVQGRLDEAMRIYEKALQLADEQGGSVLRGTADMYVGMSAIHRERNDLAGATQLLERSQELGEPLGLPQNPYRWRVAMARIREAEGDLAGAVALLDEAERRYVGDFSPNVRPVAALRARVWIAQGKVENALEWAREQGLSADDDLSYLHEFEHITLARALPVDEATPLLERLLHAADDGGRTGSVIEILILQALAHQERGDTSAALVPLERALTLAEPSGYVRIVVDEGLRIEPVLEAAADREIVAAFARRLLSALDAGRNVTPANQTLIDPLSDRELDVLRLLETDLSGPDIARELVVSLNTVRTHTRNIYAKLGVNNRRSAVRRAQELDLSSRTRGR
jgi:LuxR family maltose regulon positive regulatory protein